MTKMDKYFKIVDGELLEYYGNGGDLIIPDSVTRIADEVFAENKSLTSVFIPASVRWIGDMAFKCCSNIVRFEVDENNEFLCSIDGDLYTKDGTELINYAQGKDDASISVPDGVTYIRNVVFKGCKSLERVHIPNTVNRIECAAFRGCTNLTRVEIPGAVEELVRWVFAECTALTEVYLNDGTWFIGEGAFEGCTNLREIYIPDSVERIFYDAFWACDKLTIHAHKGSCAEEFAKENKIPFVAIEQ
jgi:hypothetical protein